MAIQNVHLSFDHHSARIEIGGINIADSVHALCLTADSVDRVPRLELELLVIPAEIDGPAAVRFGEHTHAALIALGWTPPQD